MVIEILKQGTTGKPKGATLSHHNIVNNSMLVGFRAAYHAKPHRMCLSVPLYHCFGSVVGGLALQFHGGLCILPSPSFNALECLKAIESEKYMRLTICQSYPVFRCTGAYGTPTMFVDMLKIQKEKKFEVSSMETGVMSGAPCPEDLCK